MTAHTCVASGNTRRGFPFTVAMTGPDCCPGFLSTWILLESQLLRWRFKTARNTTDAGVDRGMNAVKQIIARQRVRRTSDRSWQNVGVYDRKTLSTPMRVKHPRNGRGVPAPV